MTNYMVPDWARAHVSGLLDAIEREHDVRILMAVESGSRAWGFPSPDSDYDVRFVYARPLDWYLSIDDRRDVIETPIIDDFDVNGWDIRKAMQLLLKPNAVLLEWLSSPIIYRSCDRVLDELRGIADRVSSRTACRHHYLHLGDGQYRRFLGDRETVAVKKYFYVLRPALALRWLRSNETGRLPMALYELIAGVDLPREVGQFIDELLERKRHTRELGDSPRLEVLDRFIADELDRARSAPLEREWLDDHVVADVNNFVARVVRSFDPSYAAQVR